MPTSLLPCLRGLAVGLALLAPALGQAQPIVTGADRPLDAPARAAIINELGRQLQAQYVFPKVAAQVQQALQQQLAAGAYDQLTSSKDFARAVTAQLQQVSHDKHLRLFYHQQPPAAEDTPADESAAQQAYGRQVNFGFGRADVLAGNVGYLRLDEFMPVGLAAETAPAALTYLQHTDALLLDLRYNHGGEPAMVAYLASYFFGPEPVHLNDIVRRSGTATEAYWTRRELPGRRYLSRPVYILTSRQTFSAAEECAYDLQALHRATIVGEPTAGGANSGENVRLSEHFTAFIPTEYANNPLTHSNWEGTGVQPDLAASATQALSLAHATAVAAISRNASPARQAELASLLTKLQAEAAAPAPPSSAATH